MLPPGISLKKLPPIDIILVSHNHYDHLDEETVESLPHKDKIQVVVPLGLKAFFTEYGYTHITELDWHQETRLKNITLTAQPAVHDSARSTCDHNKTLWASWTILGPDTKILFVGDSAYSDSIFKTIGEKFGQLDYALLPISAYAPRELMWMSHMTPEEAVAAGRDARARTLIASHWGTINLSDAPPWEPPKRFYQAAMENGLDKKQIWIMKIGETRALQNR